jgi:hypothetical protein
MLDTLLREPLFAFCAYFGLLFFAVEYLLRLLGLYEEDMEGQLKWLSKPAWIGFFMVFGWVGLTCREQFELSLQISCAVAVGCGLFTFILVGLVLRGFRILRSTGTVFRVEELIGKEAIVYQRIPKGGVGKVSISAPFTHEVDAISAEELDSFSVVTIVNKVDDKTVLVVPKEQL